MRYQTVVVRMAVALLILVMSKPAHAASCNTPDITTGDRFGGNCAVTCDGSQDPGAVLSAYRASIVMTCDDGTRLEASGGLCLGVDDRPLDDCVARSSAPQSPGSQCSCTSFAAPIRCFPFPCPGPLPPIGTFPDPGGVVIDAKCEC
jgi:hypothetical protein